MIGQLHQGVEVCSQVRLAADQKHLGAGAELLDLPFPLEEKRTEQTMSSVETGRPAETLRSSFERILPDALGLGLLLLF